MRLTAATLLGLLIAVFTNYATQFGPAWTTNPWIVWPVLGLLAVLAVIVALRSASPNIPAVPASATRLDSLRPPTLDVPVRGREAELSRMEKLVKRPGGRFAVVCGPGGTGKTTLAAELAARTGATVWWIRWRDQESFAAQMLEIAEALGMPQVPGRGLPDLVWDALTKHSRWLLVVDNVDRPQALSPTGELLSAHRGWVRDGGGGLLLITSRDTDPHTWGRGAELITLAPLLTDDAATVLLDAAPHAGNRAQAEALATRLGGFPLALRAAGLALAQPTARHRMFDAYREALDIELADTLAAKHDGPLTEAQERALLRYTWELSLDQLAEEGHPLARPLLRMLSLTADAPLPRDLITPELLQPVVECEVTGAAVDSALAGLHRYGLVLTVSEVALHPLVREINALLLSEESDAKPWLETLDRILLADADETANSGRAGWRRARLLAPHLVPILGRLGDQPEAVLPARDKVERVAGALRDAGNAASELLLWRAVLDAELSVLGPHHRSSLASRGNLANALNDLGEYQQAADLLRQNLADRERILHVDHPDTLMSRNNLAHALSGLGEYQQAADLLRQNLADRERILHVDHPDTLMSRNNLAIALDNLGEHRQAAELHQQTLADCERVLGPDHPDTLASRNNLANALRRLREHRQAAELHQQTLADYERVLGPDHPDTLMSRNNLANALRHLGEHRQAAELHQKNVVDCERVLGPDHPHTLLSRSNLAVALAALARSGRGQRGGR